MEIKEARLYKMSELEKILGLERHTISKMIDDGVLKGIPTKKFGHRRVFGKFLLDYLEGRKGGK